MYAYCLNEPVFRKDSLGTESVSATNKENDDNPLNDLGKNLNGGSSGRGLSSPRYMYNQGAVIDLAKEYREGMTVADAKIILGWADEYGIKNHGIMIHPARSGIWSYTPHIKIANVHIPIIKE